MTRLVELQLYTVEAVTRRLLSPVLGKHARTAHLHENPLNWVLF